MDLQSGTKPIMNQRGRYITEVLSEKVVEIVENHNESNVSAKRSKCDYPVLIITVNSLKPLYITLQIIKKKHRGNGFLAIW